MLDALPKEGFEKSTLVVKSDNVDTSGKTFEKMKSEEKSWRLQDRYKNPGPIQFYLDDSV